MADKKLFLEIYRSIDFDKIIDHPNILIAANFWDKERYLAACTCYRFMRMIDDLIDNYKAENKKIEPGERKKFTDDVEKWLGIIKRNEASTTFQEELLFTLDRFRIPSWALEAFARSMIYDINNDGFDTIDEYLSYSQGASVAPASIFVHLAGLRELDGIYDYPLFDVRKTATPCALFSYLVHIIRDFRKDRLNNLNYFAEDVIRENGLSHEQLQDIAQGGVIPEGFRKMIKRYYDLADEYRMATIGVMNEVCPMLSPRYRLSLEIIFELYLMVFERIDILNGTFSTEELNPTSDEIKERVLSVIMRQQA